MTDPTAPTKPAVPSSGAMQLLIDLGPIAVFMIAFNVLERFPALKENAVYYATGLFIAATLAAVAYCQFVRGKVPPVLIITAIIVLAFGGLTIALHNETFIKLKPTVLWGFYGAAILGSLAIGQNIWRLLMQHALTLPDPVWNTLALRWGLFFVAMAAMNEFLRLTQSTETWVSLHTIAFFACFFVFAALNMPLIIKHLPDDDSATTAPPAA
ncbi:MAG: inner membrane-spanning protein YciB [Terricaulis sp.]